MHYLALDGEAGVGATATRHKPNLYNPIYKMEERIMAELQALKQLTLLSAKNVLTIDDVTLLTGVSKSALYKMTCAREIPHYKRGKFLFFDRAEIERWMKENRVATTEEMQGDALAYCARRHITKGGVQ